MAAFKFNLQQLDLLGAYDRYTKELEDQKKEEIYENKLVEQEVDNFVKYYNPKSLRENDSPLLYNEFKNYETAAKALNKARRTGNVDEINKYRKSMQDATVNMGDLYNQSTIAKKVAADLAVFKDQERKGLIAIDDKDYNDKFTLFTTGSLNDIKNKFGKADTWGSVMTGVEYDNNKYNESLGKTITAFNSNKNNYITGTAPVEYQTQKLENGDDFKIPVFEKVPDYNKALQLAMVQPEAMKKKVFQQFNAELAQGGTISDIARIRQDKVAKIFKKTPDQLTADDLLAYQIAGDARKEADFKQGKAVWQMNMDEAKFKYKQELDKKKAEIAKIKAANKGKGDSGGKITNMELTLLTNYYKESKDNFTNPQGVLINAAALNTFLEGVDPKIVGFIHQKAPKTKSDPKEMNKVLQGYMKNPQSLYGALNP
jgi:hypothetical protein